MSEKLTLSDVFNEAAVPVVTFVPPKEFPDLVGSLRTKGKHVTLCGPSGCGKTTLAKKALTSAKIPAEEIHWMSGRDRAACGSWQEVFSIEFGCSEDPTEVQELLAASGIVVIDDFHHLKLPVRDSIGKLLKLWHEKNIRVFVIGIAESTHHLLELDPELGIRNDPYDMRTQKSDFIHRVIEAGEKALNFTFSPETRETFTQASKGIPSAIQIICRMACQRHDIYEPLASPKEVSCAMEEIRDGVLRSYKGKYFNKVIGLAKGKQQARSVHNTYFQIVRHICLLDKSEIEVEELQARIVGPHADAKEKNKKNTSFYNCLANLQDVIVQRGLADAIYYDGVSKTIAIEDPSFRLYLTLMDIAQVEKAVRVRASKYPYDVAISFAGERRKVVEELVGEINRLGYTVFYDFDQQHLLWGQNLRVRLQDVYANEAEYMIIVLSKEYPEKDWPSFEFEVGKDARSKRTEEYLLPLRVDDVHVVGLPTDVGHLDLRTISVREVAEILAKKIEAKEEAKLLFTDAPVAAPD